MANQKISLLVVPTSAKSLESQLNLSLDVSVAIAKQAALQGKKVAFFQPIAGKANSSLDKSELKEQGIIIGEPVNYGKALHLIAYGRQDELMELIVAEHEKLLNKVDFIIVRGIYDINFGASINQLIANTVQANILLVGSDSEKDVNSHLDSINAYVVANLSNFIPSNRILGLVLQHGHQAQHNPEQQHLSPIKVILELDKDESVKSLQTKINANFINFVIKNNCQRNISPALFRKNLTTLSQSIVQRIVLPEGDEPRTLKAAIYCQNNKIAHCVLLGEKSSIDEVCKQHDLLLPEDIEIIDPSTIRAKYVDRLVELRSSKGMTVEKAKKELEDNVFLATMMLEQDDVDGLVSGAIHSTANTIRPSLQVIKAAPGSSLVSSCFFMLLPEQVIIFADCAVNVNPNAAQLADIAIQSHDTAKDFGIPARVAMISYSTYGSGSGPDVELVEEATKLVREKRPDIEVGGPLQYDAATVPSVAKSKAPNCSVAGQATVFIFPSLSVGNAVYKAVQRSADVLAVGPMLQGLNKPVNDLSRGALVKDIIYTIALTSIQSIGRKKIINNS